MMFVPAVILLNLHVPCMLQLFGGLLIALESLPPWVQWLKYFSFIRYGIEVSYVYAKLYLHVCCDCLLQDGFQLHGLCCTLVKSNCCCMAGGLLYTP